MFVCTREKGREWEREKEEREGERKGNTFPFYVFGYGEGRRERKE